MTGSHYPELAALMFGCCQPPDAAERRIVWILRSRAMSVLRPLGAGLAGISRVSFDLLEPGGRQPR